MCQWDWYNNSWLGPSTWWCWRTTPFCCKTSSMWRTTCWLIWAVSTATPAVTSFISNSSIRPDYKGPPLISSLASNQSITIIPWLCPLIDTYNIITSNYLLLLYTSALRWTNADWIQNCQINCQVDTAGTVADRRMDSSGYSSSTVLHALVLVKGQPEMVASFPLLPRLLPATDGRHWTSACDPVTTPVARRLQSASGHRVLYAGRRLQSDVGVAGGPTLGVSALPSWLRQRRRPLRLLPQRWRWWRLRSRTQPHQTHRCQIVSKQSLISYRFTADFIVIFRLSRHG